jgi:DNA invertase Pin-like site-specific DNA recombinase
MEIVTSYSDAGKSGLTVENRPVLKQMIADVENGSPGYSAILVYDVSRWGRFQESIWYGLCLALLALESFLHRQAA